LCRDYPNGLVRTVGHYLIYLYAEWFELYSLLFSYTFFRIS
jgi:hypothetical protein